MRETFWQMTQKLWATKTWDLDNCLKISLLWHFIFLASFQFIFLLRPNFTTICSSRTETMSYFFKRGRRSYWGGRQVRLSSSYSNFPTLKVDIRIFDRGGCLFKAWGGDTPLYKPYRYVPPHRVGVLRRFGLKTGTHFAYFGLESGMVFEGTTGV